MYDSVPPGQGFNLFLRCFQASLINIIELSIIKYISLVFQGIARNLTPIATVFLSFLMTGEKFKTVDIVFILVSLFGVTLTTIGFSINKSSSSLEYKDSKNDDEASNPLHIVTIVATIATFAVPFISAWGNITTRKMRDLHENTVSCYLNPSMALFMFSVIVAKSEIADTLALLKSVELLDWLLFALTGVGAVVF